jgi:hypothetical protein
VTGGSVRTSGRTLNAAGLMLLTTALIGTTPAAEPRAPLVPVIHHQAAPTDGGYWVVSSRDQGAGDLARGHRHSHQVFACDARGRRSGSKMEALVGSLAPGVPVCIVMHGSFVDWETVWQDARGTNAWLRAPAPDRPLHVIFFTWPSDDTPKLLFPIDVAILGRRSARHSFYVAELVSLIPDDHPICLVGHSHGARMVVSTLHVLGGGRVDDVAFGGGPFHQHRIRAVLAAGAFDHDWLNPGERYEHAIQRPELILNLQNRRDLALGFYPLHRPLTAPAGGRTGFSEADRQQIGAISQKLVDIDITRFIGPGHIWPHYYAQPQLARAIAPHVFFLDAAPVTDVVRSQTPSPRTATNGQRESQTEVKWTDYRVAR